NLTDVGLYSGTPSPYGAFDMGGNVFQWNEALINGSQRGLRVASFSNDSLTLVSSARSNFNPALVNNGIGFRVAMVPEPSTAVLAIIGVAMIWLAKGSQIVHRQK